MIALLENFLRHLMRLKTPSVIPGFAFAMSFTLLYLALVVIIPLMGLFAATAHMSWDGFIAAVTAPRVMAAYRVTFGISFIAAIVNLFFGLIVAWVLARYRLPMKQFLDALVDIPFALPTAVAGIALSTLYSPRGWIGSLLAPLGIQAAFNPTGIAIALVFVGAPFVIRTVEPVLQDIDVELEEAAAGLGASRWQTFCLVILPQILPALLTGFAMSFARGLGEYGSVIFIAGNMPMVSEIVPLVIVSKLEQYDYAGASAIASVMLVASLLLLIGINFLERWSAKDTVR